MFTDTRQGCQLFSRVLGGAGAFAFTTGFCLGGGLALITEIALRGKTTANFSAACVPFNVCDACVASVSWAEVPGGQNKCARPQALAYALRCGTTPPHGKLNGLGAAPECVATGHSRPRLRSQPELRAGATFNKLRCARAPRLPPLARRPRPR